MKIKRVAAITMASLSVLALSACGLTPGAKQTSSVKQEPASKEIPTSEKITLTVWDQNTEGAMSEVQEKLNAQFKEEYPNITIKRTAQSFKDLKTTLKLALSSNTPPDVIQANQGYPDMGAFVAAGMLRPLDDYAKLYGWDSYYPKNLLDFNSFSKDGKHWQGDTLYGVSQTGELIGIYYNRVILKQLGYEPPKNLEEFNATLQAAKSAGILPISYGDLEKSPGIQILGVVQGAMAGSKYVNNLTSGKSGAWTDDVNIKAAQQIVEWQTEGYLTDGGNGVSRDTAIADFGAGKALYTIQGTWQEQPIKHALGEDAGFLTLTSDTDNKPVTTGGEGLAWAITSKSEHANAAAAYIDFITNAQSAQTLLDTDSLPTVLPKDYAPSDKLKKDIVTNYRSIQEASGVVPYLDYTTSTAYDTIAAGMQDLVAGQITAQELMQSLQDNYEAFLKNR